MSMSRHGNSRTRRLVAGVVCAATASIGVGLPAAAGRNDVADSLASHAAHALVGLDDGRGLLDPARLLSHLAEREAILVALADQLDVDLVGLRAEWAATPTAKLKVVLAALSQLGTPYRSLGNAPSEGFDCSGLTSWAHAQAGVDIPRISSSQINAATSVARDSVQPGDLVYYPGHVGLYVGAGAYVHSPYTGTVVRVDPLPARSLRFGEFAS